MPTFEFSSSVPGSLGENLFEKLGAKFKVIGIGGAVGNAVNSMIDMHITGVEFIAVNSDFQDLQKSKAKRIIQTKQKKALKKTSLMSRPRGYQ